MPQIISVKFAQEEMPAPYDPNGIAEINLQDFVVAERDGDHDIGFVAGIEWVSSEQLKRRMNPHKRILRIATAGEKDTFFARRALERKAIALCKEKAREFNLPMKISYARVSPRDERIVFHFTSDQRVDFRQLVRELSLILKSRIELWQIGVRDEAKHVDGFGVCGLRTCCSSWLTEFRPINIRMAKEQDIHLPPAKLSGLCGRLLCCLSYEVDQYREMGKALLPKGATIRLGDREGVIIDRNIITQSYSVQFQEGAIQTVKAEEVGDVKVPDQMKKMARTFDGTAPKQADAPRPPKPVAAKPDRSAQIVEAATEPEEAEGTEGEDSGEQTGRKKKRRRRRGGRGGNKDAAQAAAVEAAPAAEAAQASGSDVEAGERKSGRRGRRRGGRRRGGQDQGGGHEGGEAETED